MYLLGVAVCWMCMWVCSCVYCWWQVVTYLLWTQRPVCVCRPNQHHTPCVYVQGGRVGESGEEGVFGMCEWVRVVDGCLACERVCVWRGGEVKKGISVLDVCAWGKGEYEGKGLGRDNMCTPGTHRDMRVWATVCSGRGREEGDGVPYQYLRGVKAQTCVWFTGEGFVGERDRVCMWHVDGSENSFLFILFPKVRVITTGPIPHKYKLCADEAKTNNFSLFLISFMINWLTPYTCWWTCSWRNNNCNL